jgi:hypothetical protein
MRENSDYLGASLVADRLNVENGSSNTEYREEFASLDVTACLYVSVLHFLFNTSNVTTYVPIVIPSIKHNCELLCMLSILLCIII